MKKHLTLLLIAVAFAFGVLPAQTGNLEATVVARRGNLIELKLESQEGEAFQTGTAADMFKHFEEKMGNMSMSGWLGVAKVEFVPTTKQNIQIKILEEKGEITVNGEKVDHFKTGKRMKLEWPAKTEEKSEE